MERTFLGPPQDPNKYELLDCRSRGGEGEVWRGAMHVDGTAVPVAIKIIHSHNLDDFAVWKERWNRQAEVLRTLDHPGLVKVREMFSGAPPHAWQAPDTATETLYLVMNWVEGPTITEWVARNPNRDPLESIRVITALASAVDYLHRQAIPGQPVLHRDIKPSNVIVTDDGVKLLDFGFVRVVRADQSMTMVGSPSYIAPEVAAGLGYSEASDLYAFGATSLFTLTGQSTTMDDNAPMQAKLATLRGFQNKPSLVQHAIAMVAMDPARRPSSAIEWAQGLAVLSLSDSSMTVPRPAPQPSTTPMFTVPVPVAAPPKRGRGKLIAAGVGIVAVIAIAAAALLSRGGDDDSKNSLVAAGSGGAAASTTLSPGTTGSTTSTTTSTSTTTTTSTTRATKVAPDVVGKTLDEASTALRNLGATVEVERIYDPAKKANTVISQTPAAGQPIGTTATIKVAREAASLYVDALSSVASTAEAKTGETLGVSGQTLTHCIRLTGYLNYTSSIEYNLARSFDRLQATVGYLDTAPRDGKIRLEITLDNAKIYTKDFELGGAENIDLPVTGGLRLVVSATALTRVNSGQPAVVLGEAKLSGDPAQVEKFVIKKN